MVIDTLANAKKYYSLHPVFKQAFEFALSRNWQTEDAGKYEISGDDLKASISEKMGKTQAESLEKFECHDRHIDIQLCLKGNETIGWKPRGDCHTAKDPYNAEKDVTFFTETPDTYFQLTDNQFAIFFPEDVHAPMIGNDVIKKMVIKVKL